MKKELIKVQTNENGEGIVNGRELHEFLEVNSNYTTWIKRMLEYGFSENVDFVSVWSDSKNGNAVEFEGSAQKMSAKGYTLNHVLKLDMAKEVSMIQRNEKGRKARQYFIECEKKLYSLKENLPSYMIENPKERAKRWIEEYEEKEQLSLENTTFKQQIGEMKPKVSYYDIVLKSPSAMTVTEISKDYGMSANKFNQLLHGLGIQFKQGKVWFLYSKYHDKGYTKTETYTYDEDKTRVSTKWTQKGRLFLYDILKQNDVLPMIEQEDIAS